MRPVKVGLGAAAAGFLAGCAGLGGTGGTTYRVPSPAMVPTLRVGQVVAVDKGAFSGRSPRVGEIIVLHGPEQAITLSGGNQCANPKQGQPSGAACAVPGATLARPAFIKRVVGLPGDRIEMVSGRVVRNGQPLNEPYVRPCSDPICNYPKPITVPAETFFVLGDNRGQSDDSRFWGPVRRSWIIGLAKP